MTVYGEQRGCALADYDGDGRVDLAVTQNGAETKLYHNIRAKPGLRVRLLGNSGNPSAVGAAMRLFFETGPGPVREIHAGSGYWSQDGAIQVVAALKPAKQIWVRWPTSLGVTEYQCVGQCEQFRSNSSNTDLTGLFTPFTELPRTPHGNLPRCPTRGGQRSSPV